MTNATAETTTSKKKKKNGVAGWPPPRVGSSVGDTKLLRLGDVVADDTWNSRSTATAFGTGRVDDGQTEAPDRELTDDELADSIKQHGILQSCGVRLDDVGGDEPPRYLLVWGFRRFRTAMRVLGPDAMVTFTVAKVDDYGARALNLTENLQRKALRPFEIAMALDKMKRAKPERMPRELAGDVGLSYPYVSNLLRVATKACPQLWDLFVSLGTSYGNGITYKDFVSTVRLSKDEQMAAWQALVDERTGAKAAGSKGSQSKASKGPSALTLAGFLSNASRLKGPEPFKAGVAYALQVALGERAWFGPGAWSRLKQKKRKAARATKKRKPTKRKTRRSRRA